jgi:tRNA1(Val) A37 N6-methylase TrmN6
MVSLGKQDLSIVIENKQNFGEVHTPYSFIERMFELLPESIFYEPERKWLDPGAGRGYFSLYLYDRLMRSLEKSFPNPEKRRSHIISNMIWMIELNPAHTQTVKAAFNASELNLISKDFLLMETNELPEFDVVIGNPPFNSGGLKKVPTNNEKSKKMDGKTIWSQFIKKSISFLSPTGLLLFVVPSIWMKEDKEGMYFYMNQYKIHKLHCLTNTEMNRIFKGHAQTPSCYFLLEKKSTEKKVLLYDKDVKAYVEYPLRSDHILPVACAFIAKKLMPYVDKYGSLNFVKKSNLPGKNINLSPQKSKNYSFPNIKTCILKEKIQPELVVEYSNKPCVFHGKKKLVLAHGMYGFPYIDATGEFGISNRDKYVFLSDNNNELKILHRFLSSPLVFYMWDSTRYRMKYLEKYVFSLLPNVLKMSEEERKAFELDMNIKIPQNKYLSL